MVIALWSFALEEEHQERFFFLYIHSDSAILADTVVAACLFGNRQEDIPPVFPQSIVLPHSGA